jgi:hypothetical protein
MHGGFRDQSQVERIRERLWSGREFGRAAVMVGAGFSHNAERGGPSVPVFPLWGDIANTMYEALYPVGSLEETARSTGRKARAAGTGAMRLASEFEMTFGRQALDDLLIRAILDSFRNWVLKLDFVESVRSQAATDGTAQVAVVSSPGEEVLPNLLIEATVPLPPRSPEDERTFIDWSLDEAVGFLRKIATLWDAEKRAVGSHLSGGPVDAFGGIGERIEGRLRLLSEVVLPRMEDADDEDKALAERFFAEVEQAGAQLRLRFQHSCT